MTDDQRSALRFSVALLCAATSCFTGWGAVLSLITAAYRAELDTAAGGVLLIVATLLLILGAAAIADHDERVEDEARRGR